jgi:hypothetical protein
MHIRHTFPRFNLKGSELEHNKDGGDAGKGEIVRPLSIWAILITVLAVVPPCFAGSRPTAKIARGIKTALGPQDDQTDGILTVSEGNLYVQCLSSHFLRGWRCEAAGLKGQSWLRHVLKADRQKQLVDLGFTRDEAFGNFVAVFPETTKPGQLANKILLVLTTIYDAEADDIDVRAERVPSNACHPRINPDIDGGGSMLTPKWGPAKYAAKDCTPRPAAPENDYDDPKAVIPNATGIDVEARYQSSMTLQLARLEAVKAKKDAFVIFGTGPAYVQCIYDRTGKRLYCEAVSEDAVGKPIERILTPERKAKLAEAGFRPPGRTMNYGRFYPQDQYDTSAVAKALLGVLRDAYGYQGAPEMDVTTEGTTKRPLVSATPGNP